MPELRQSVGNAVASGQSRTCSVSLDQPTLAGSCVVVIAVATHSTNGYYPLSVSGPSGFTRIFERVEDELTVEIYIRPNCPPITNVSVYSPGDRSLQVRVLEYTGVAQASVLDRLAAGGDNEQFKSGSSQAKSGTTATTTQADEVVIGVIANRYASTTQSGFTGGMQQLSNTQSPATWGNGKQDKDEDRTRVTVHQAIQTTTKQWSIGAQLSAKRDWIAVVATLKGGTTGPLRMSSKAQPTMITIGGGGAVTVFGPLRSQEQPPMINFGGGGRVGPFEMQMRLGGWQGLLIGAGTDYRIEKIEGLGGADVRTSDGELAHEHGSTRGIDLQSARLVQITVNFDHPSTSVLEQMHADLLAALVPQREADDDWDLLFRLPGRPLQLIRCRPIQIAREFDLLYRVARSQSFVLRASDPRIYSARERIVPIEVTPAGQDLVTVVSAVNGGNARAYPVIQIDNRGSVPLTGLQLVNATADVAFEVEAVIPPGAQLIGDMPARITQTGRSPVTLDGQPRYNAWLPPRDAFYLAPDPVAIGGSNAIYLRTTPAGADVACTLTYRDTWAS